MHRKLSLNYQKRRSKSLKFNEVSKGAAFFTVNMYLYPLRYIYLLLLLIQNSINQSKNRSTKNFFYLYDDTVAVGRDY